MWSILQCVVNNTTGIMSAVFTACNDGSPLKQRCLAQAGGKYLCKDENCDCEKVSTNFNNFQASFYCCPKKIVCPRGTVNKNVPCKQDINGNYVCPPNSSGQFCECYIPDRNRPDRNTCCATLRPPCRDGSPLKEPCVAVKGAYRCKDANCECERVSSDPRQFQASFYCCRKPTEQRCWDNSTPKSFCSRERPCRDQNCICAYVTDPNQGVCCPKPRCGKEFAKDANPSTAVFDFCVPSDPKRVCREPGCYCQPISSNSKLGFCCPGGVCADGSRPYDNNAVEPPLFCSGSDAKKCPDGYQCTAGVTPYDQRVCCRVEPVCPSGLAPFNPNPTPYYCDANRCPAGYLCTPGIPGYSRPMCCKGDKPPGPGECGFCALNRTLKFLRDSGAKDCCFYWGVDAWCEGCCESTTKVYWQPGQKPKVSKDCDCCLPTGRPTTHKTWIFCLHGPDIQPNVVCPHFNFNPPWFSCSPTYTYRVASSCRCKDCDRKLVVDTITDFAVSDMQPTQAAIQNMMNTILDEKEAEYEKTIRV